MVVCTLTGVLLLVQPSLLCVLAYLHVTPARSLPAFSPVVVYAFLVEPLLLGSWCGSYGCFSNLLCGIRFHASVHCACLSLLTCGG